jgi:hypothetical protein
MDGFRFEKHKNKQIQNSGQLTIYENDEDMHKILENMIKTWEKAAKEQPN